MRPPAVHSFTFLRCFGFCVKTPVSHAHCHGAVPCPPSCGAESLPDPHLPLPWHSPMPFPGVLLQSPDRRAQCCPFSPIVKSCRSWWGLASAPLLWNKQTIGPQPLIICLFHHLHIPYCRNGVEANTLNLVKMNSALLPDPRKVIWEWILILFTQNKVYVIATNFLYSFPVGFQPYVSV